MGQEFRVTVAMRHYPQNTQTAYIWAEDFETAKNMANSIYGASGYMAIDDSRIKQAWDESTELSRKVLLANAQVPEEHIAEYSIKSWDVLPNGARYALIMKYGSEYGIGEGVAGAVGERITFEEPAEITYENIRKMNRQAVQDWYNQGVIGQDLYERYMDEWRRSTYRYSETERPQWVVGPFSTQGEAQTALERIRAKGLRADPDGLSIIIQGQGLAEEYMKIWQAVYEMAPKGVEAGEFIRAYAEPTYKLETSAKKWTDAQSAYAVMRTYIHQANTYVQSGDYGAATDNVKFVEGILKELRTDLGWQTVSDFKTKYKDDWKMLQRIKRFIKVEEAG